MRGLSISSFLSIKWMSSEAVYLFGSICYAVILQSSPAVLVILEPFVVLRLICEIPVLIVYKNATVV